MDRKFNVFLCPIKFRYSIIMSNLFFRKRQEERVESSLIVHNEEHKKDTHKKLTKKWNEIHFSSQNGFWIICTYVCNFYSKRGQTWRAGDFRSRMRAKKNYCYSSWLQRKTWECAGAAGVVLMMSHLSFTFPIHIVTLHYYYYCCLHLQRTSFTLQW